MTTTRHPLLRELPPPRRVRTHAQAHWFVVASVSVGAFMGQLDASIVTLATPAIQRSFGISLGEASWVALSYLLVLVSAVVPIGHLADAAGRKMVYVYGFALFTLASAACALAPNLGVLIGGRAVQGIGAAMLQANSVALIRLAMPAGKVGRGIGMQAVAQALGLALGPSVGGVLVHVAGWRSVFLVNLPAGVVGIIAGLLLLPASHSLRRSTPWDAAGVALLGIASTGTLLALTALEHGALLSWRALLAALVALLGWYALGSRALHRQRSGQASFLPLDLLARTHFRQALVAGLLSYLVLFGMLFIAPFTLERNLGWNPGEAGLFLSLLPAAIAVVTPFAGRLADAHGARRPTTLGMTLATAGLLLAASAPSTPLALASGLVLLGIGSGLFTPANNAAIMLLAPSERAGVAGGLLNMTRAFGTALGVAVVSIGYSLGGSDLTGSRVAMVILCLLAATAASVARAATAVPVPA